MPLKEGIHQVKRGWRGNVSSGIYFSDCILFAKLTWSKNIRRMLISLISYQTNIKLLKSGSNSQITEGYMKIEDKIEFFL